MGETRTDAAGKFRFEHVAEGEYAIRIDARIPPLHTESFKVEDGKTATAHGRRADRKAEVVGLRRRLKNVAAARADPDAPSRTATSPAGRARAESSPRRAEPRARRA